MDAGIQLAFGDHGLDRFVVGERGEFDVRGHVDGDVLIELLVPVDGAVRHAIFVFQNPFHPEDGGDLPVLDAHLLANQILGFFDPGIGVDEDKAVPEPAVQEHRQGLERKPLILGHQIGRTRRLGHVEILVVVKPPVPRGRIHIGQHRQIDTIGLDRAIHQGPCNFIFATGQRQGNFLVHSNYFLFVHRAGLRPAPTL